MNGTSFFDMIAEAAGKDRYGGTSLRENSAAWRSLQSDSSAPGAATGATAATAAKQTGAGEKSSPSAKKTQLALKEVISSCKLCPLAQKRMHSVPGEGAKNPPVMFIGEAPGLEEDKQGRPFVGAAGELLDKMIKAMKFTREEVFLTCLVKCRPPYSREATPEELEKCVHYLHAEIAENKPRMLVIMGSFAATSLLGGKDLEELRGKWFSLRDVPCVATYSPQYLLRHEEAKRAAWQDLKMVMSAFGRQ